MSKELVEELRIGAAECEVAGYSLRARKLTEAADTIERVESHMEATYRRADENLHLLTACELRCKAHTDTIERLERENVELRDALKWYVDNDEVNDQEGNEFWLEGKARAEALLAKEKTT